MWFFRFFSRRPFLWLVLALTVLGCESKTYAPPYRPREIRRHPHGSETMRRCQDALDDMVNLPLDEQLPSVLQACSELYVEEMCRQALRTLLDVPARDRALRLAQQCRFAYCGKLPAPRPDLCDGDLAELDDDTLRERWRQFNWRVFQWDLGTGDPLEGLAFRYLEAAPPEGRANERDTPELPASVRLTLTREGNGYLLHATGATLAPRSQALVDTFTAQDIERWLREELAISKSTPLELASDRQGTGLSRLMRGAADAGFMHLTVVP